MQQRTDHLHLAALEGIEDWGEHRTAIKTSLYRAERKVRKLEQKMRASRTSGG